MFYDVRKPVCNQGQKISLCFLTAQFILRFAAGYNYVYTEILSCEQYNYNKSSFCKRTIFEKTLEQLDALGVKFIRYQTIYNCIVRPLFPYPYI